MQMWMRLTFFSLKWIIILFRLAIYKKKIIYLFLLNIGFSKTGDSNVVNPLHLNPCRPVVQLGSHVALPATTWPPSEKAIFFFWITCTWDIMRYFQPNLIALTNCYKEAQTRHVGVKWSIVKVHPKKGSHRIFFLLIQIRRRNESLIN